MSEATDTGQHRAQTLDDRVGALESIERAALIERTAITTSLRNAVIIVTLSAAGAIDGYPMAFAARPTTTGATTRGTPPWDVRGGHWMRVRMTDADATNRGAITGMILGGES